MAFYITVFRSLKAVSLGIALLVQPDKTRPFLANFMGMYWLGSALLSIRWGIAQQESKGLAIGVGLVGVLTGIGMLGRGIVSNYIAEDVVISLLGVTVLLTGVLHASGKLKAKQTQLHTRSWSDIVLGVFEIILGLILILAPMDRGPIIYTAVFIWAILGGIILMGDALYMRQAAKEQIENEGQLP